MIADPASTLARMLGSPTALPYHHQEAVSEHLLAGRNVVLQAPTGSGKTEAALLPFLHAWKHQLDFPRKCIYAVPLRTLANQFKTRADAWLERLGLSMEASIQTGEHPTDPKLEGDLIFATIDQLLSSALMRPYSLSSSQANLNLGSVVGSYLVLDEAHLFDWGSTLPTSLVLLKMLKGVCPFVVMTATLSGEMQEQLALFLSAQVVSVTEPSRESGGGLPSAQRTRMLSWRDELMSADAVIQHHRSRSLVVCNTVERAMNLYRDLQTRLQGEDVRLVLLHSRFRKADRARKERELVELFGREADRRTGSAIAVATQVVEVGLDISCETLHTELAPASSLVQRAGRCARYAGEVGEVYVYNVDSPSPYQEQAALVDLTREAMPAYSGRDLSLATECELVDQVHREHDRKAMNDGLLPTWISHRDAVRSVMEGRDAAGDLVRAIDSRLLLIHSDAGVVAADPFGYEGFGLHPGVIRQHLSGWLDRAQQLDLEWAVRGLMEYPEVDREGPRFQSFPVRTTEDVKGVAAFVVHPALVGYDPDLGLLLDEGTGYECARKDDELRALPVRRYRLETYQEHVQAAYQCFRQAVWPKLEWAAARLEAACGWRPGSLRKACALAVLLHDVGKLTEAWQGVARRYTSLIGYDTPKGTVFAHTEFDQTLEEHKHAQSAAGKRPPHAAEGACLSAPVLQAWLAEDTGLMRAVVTAIARHHGAFTNTTSEAALCPEAASEVRASLLMGRDELGEIRRSVDLVPRMGSVPDLGGAGLLVRADEERYFLAYALIVRALRLSDQMGTAMHSAGGDADVLG